MINNTILSAVTAALLTCMSASNAVSDTEQQTIYYGGNIITMEGDRPAYVESVIEQNGKILYAGPRSGAENSFSGKTNGCNEH